MGKFRIYGLLIESDIDFLQLIRADEEDKIADVIIKQENCKDEVTEYLTKAGSYNRKYEVGLDYSCFFNKAGYYVIKDGNSIVYETIEGYTPEMLSPWLLGYAISMILLQRKTLAIHCSAVCRKGDGSEKDVILISGYSGAGKSSLTRKLLEDGYKLMADDVVAVNCENDVIVYPAFPYQKLCRNEVDKRELDYENLIYIDEDKDKFLVPAGDVFSDIPGKLKCMVYLLPADVPDVQIKKLSGLEQLFAVKQNHFLTMMKGEWKNSQEMLSMCLKMAGCCPVYMITRPKSGDSVAIMAQLVKEIIE